MPVTILIADDESAARFGLRRALERDDCRVVEAKDGEDALRAIRAERPDLVLLDLSMPRLDGRGVLQALKDDADRPREIVVVTAEDDVAIAVDCIRLGATDYVTKPYEIERLRAFVRRARERRDLERRVQTLEGELEGRDRFGSLVGASAAMQTLFDEIERAAVAPLDILVRGETGTGKELIARELHQRSDRRNGPFVAVNTAAVQESLAESELFGHRRGAFTGADSDRDGVFVRANGGTVFLDEIGDMPAALQAKVLRVLQERVVLPLGATTSISVDIRIVSATHQNLDDAVEDGHFRRDLYFRLRGIEITVPALRHRREDIPRLARHFLDTLTKKLTSTPERNVPNLEPDALDRLLTHAWPGNVRELEHVVTGAAAMCRGTSLGPSDLRLEPRASDDAVDLDFLDGLPLTEAKQRLVEWFERRTIEAALEACDGNVSATARRLGIHRQNLQQKMEKLGLRR